MNQKLVEINNNYGIVSDENGNISFIEKENDSYNFEEILLKENNLDDLKSKLENYKNKLSDNKEKIIYDYITDACLIVLEIILFAFLHSTVPLNILIALIIGCYIIPKMVSSLLFGTRLGKHIQKKKLTTDIEMMELEINTIEKELTEIKEKSKYKVNDSTFDETIYPKISLSMDSYNVKQDKVRVLSLSKKK